MIALFQQQLQLSHFAAVPYKTGREIPNCYEAFLPLYNLTLSNCVLAFLDIFQYSVPCAVFFQMKRREIIVDMHQHDRLFEIIQIEADKLE